MLHFFGCTINIYTPKKELKIENWILKIEKMWNWVQICIKIVRDWAYCAKFFIMSKLTYHKKWAL